RDAARRSRGRCDQGGEPARRRSRPNARAHRERQERELRSAQPRQALGRDRSQARGRTKAVLAPRPVRRRGRREPAPGHDERPGSRAAGSAHKLVAPYQAIAAADRHFIVGATTPPNWTAFCRVLGLEGLERDPRYADATLRRHNRDSLIAAIEAITATKPAAHWLAALRAAGVPCGEIADYGDVFSDPHLVARQFFMDLPHPR